MRVRPLQEQDAPLMLAWMHDESVVADLAGNFAAKSLVDCQQFIAASRDTSRDLHLAIVDENDIYMGTVSLKHIDQEHSDAEFAITVCAEAMGHGFSGFGMKWILNYGLNQLGLNSIYWCVSAENKRAVRFYDKNGYHRTMDVPDHITANYTPQQMNIMLWYVAER